MPKKVFMWSPPRCVSTAFERCIMEIKNCKVIHEPFDGSYYYGPERQSSRYVADPVDETKSYSKMANLLAMKYEGVDLLYSKHMSYAIENHFDILLREDFADFQHTFLVRHPAKTVPSLYEISTNLKLGWETFDPHEAGFEQLKEVYEFVKQHFDPNPVIIDADDVLKDPEATMKAYCTAIDIPFEKEILTWEPGFREEWSPCYRWHEDVMKTSGFLKCEPEKLKILKDLTKYPDVVQQCVETSIPIYNEFYKNKTS